MIAWRYSRLDASSCSKCSMWRSGFSKIAGGRGGVGSVATRFNASSVESAKFSNKTTEYGSEEWIETGMPVFRPKGKPLPGVPGSHQGVRWFSDCVHLRSHYADERPD